MKLTGRELYQKALEITPWATQTYAKRPFPGTEEEMPLICKRAKGARFWDYDGKEYVDFFCSCGPIILGHHYTPLDEKVKQEIDEGFLFSIASHREYETAVKIAELFPSVGWVKFLKTGADATSAAVRVARAYTGKMKILQCGYHGWHDWYQCATLGCGAEFGIPSELARYTVSFRYNDIGFLEETLEKDGEIAAIVLVPYNWMDEPQEDFLQKVRQLCDRYGVLLIFDEVKSGFRLGLRGAQGVFGVEPDISCFAKAISNGYPLSVVCGKKELKTVFDQNGIITTTYAGDTLSLVAAQFTMQELSGGRVFDHIYRIGNALMEGLKTISLNRGVCFDVKGRAPISTVVFRTGDPEKDRRAAVEFSRFNFQNGLFVKMVGGPSYTLCYAHTQEDVDRALEAADRAIVKIREEVL